MVDEKAFIEHLNSVYGAITTAVRRRDADGFVSLYTPSGSLMTPDGAIIAGTEALREAFTRWTEGGWVDQHAELVELKIDEQIVVEVGRSVGTFRTDAGESTLRNNYIAVHVRAEDGKWLMQYDIWNTVPDAVPAGTY